MAFWMKNNFILYGGIYDIEIHTIKGLILDQFHREETNN